MGRIKSALEIALERTESVQGDKDSIDQFQARQEGKRLANAFLAGQQQDIAAALAAVAARQRDSVRQGLFDVLASQISLPASKDDMPRLEAVGSGLQAVIASSGFPVMYRQFVQVLAQYLAEAAQYDQAIRQQYAPKLRQKEEELSRRMGRELRLDPFQDPEFVAFYNQNMNALKAGYQAAVDQVRGETAAMFAAAAAG